MVSTATNFNPNATIDDETCKAFQRSKKPSFEAADNIDTYFRRINILN